VTATEEAEGTGNCGGRGGSKFAVGAGTPTYACNGKQGIQGKDGETGFTETLPPGKTETGAWVLGPLPTVTCEVPETSCTTEVKGETELSIVNAPISFPIPLPAQLAEANVHYLAAEAAPTTECPGSPANPQAIAGHLCVYTGEATGPPFVFVGINKAEGGGAGASTAGALITAIFAAQGSSANGTFAVTAPTSP